MKINANWKMTERLSLMKSWSYHSKISYSKFSDIQNGTRRQFCAVLIFLFNCTACQWRVQIFEKIIPIINHPSLSLKVGGSHLLFVVLIHTYVVWAFGQIIFSRVKIIFSLVFTFEFYRMSTVKWFLPQKVQLHLEYIVLHFS